MWQSLIENTTTFEIRREKRQRCRCVECGGSVVGRRKTGCSGVINSGCVVEHDVEVCAVEECGVCGGGGSRQ